jgi:ubiquinone/menaquinone biosynthesis C-methylase UbiE
MTEKASFDGVAAAYDADFTTSAVGRMQRERVHAYLKEVLKPGSRILELNCGTGEDARWLAAQGHSVLATDLSGEMVAVAEAKNKAGYDLEFRQAGILEALNIDPGTYDVIFSDFGGFNCLSPEEMKQAGILLQKALKPGGRFICVIMPRFCVWESLYYLLKLRPRAAFRRQSRQPLAVPLGQGHTQLTWYYGPRQLRGAFAPHLHLVSRRPIGFFLPPSYLDPFFAKRPGFLGWLGRMEVRVARWGLLAGWSDHCLVDFGGGGLTASPTICLRTTTQFVVDRK